MNNEEKLAKTLNNNPFFAEKKKEVFVEELSECAKVLAEESKELFLYMEQK